MKITEIILLFPLLLIFCFTSYSQNYYSAAYQNDNGSIELYLRNYCAGQLQWQTKDTASLEWQDITGATFNSYPIETTPDRIAGKEFRAILFIEPDTIPKYSYPFGIRVVDSHEEIQIGDLYDGTFLYYSSNDTMLGTYIDNYKPLEWGCSEIDFEIENSQVIGTGPTNTIEIVENCAEENTVANYCDDLILNGYDDWYLPSAHEMSLALESLISNRIHHIVEDYTQSSIENTLIQRSRELWTSSTGRSITTALNKSMTAIAPSGNPIRYRYRLADFLPSRQFDSSGSVSNMCEAILFPNQLTNYITVIDSTDRYANVLVEFQGDYSSDAIFDWDFGQGNVLSGSGKGPYLVNYDFAGFTQIELTITEGECVNEIYYSKPFRLNIFDRLTDTFPEIYNGAIDAIDINNDNLLDVFLSGDDTTALYINQGNKIFNYVSIEIPNLDDAISSWSDYNNDNFIDLLISGKPKGESESETYLFRNTGNNTFEKQNTNLENLTNGSINWLDFNNDGMMDVVITGFNIDSVSTTKLYQGNKTEFFIEVASEIPAVFNSEIIIDDYNRDNFKDFVILGKEDSIRLTEIYTNNEGAFELLESELLPIDNGASVWGDFDNDGKIDLFVTGSKEDVTIDDSGTLSITVAGTIDNSFYYQNSVGAFEKRTNHLYHQRPLTFTGMDVGDCNNDGLLDILSIGVPSASWVISGSVTQSANDWRHRSQPTLLINRSNGFSKSEANLPNSWGRNSFEWNISTRYPYNSMAGYAAHTLLSTFESSSCALADFDNDGNLDILREGRGNLANGEHTSIFFNKVLKSNIAPSSPTNLNSEKLSCNSVIVDWSASVDDHTIESNINYEIYLGTEPGKGDVFSKKNIRKIRNTYFQFNNLDDGQYYWGVKAVDDAKTSSNYSIEKSFVVSCTTNTAEINLSDFRVYPNPFGDQFIISSVSSKKKEYVLMDQFGNIIERGFFKDNTAIENTNLPAGIYYLKVIIGGLSTIKKVVCIK
jgi:hypothetical protein